MQVTFYGGAGGVTGSKHLIDTGQQKILLDCGTFQGQSDVYSRNRSLPFAPESIDHVILSHAHIDHCGMLPLLVKRGFSGSIFATGATRDVARYMLSDMAKIQEQDAGFRRRHRTGSPDSREPLYTTKDIPETMDRFVEVPYARDDKRWRDVAPGVKLKFYDAGHILGSAVTVLEIDTDDGPKRIAYTGDVGAPGTPLFYDPQVPDEEIDTVIAESTYGGKSHHPLEDMYGRLAETIKQVVARKGKIIIPAFSLGRTQVIVYVLHKLTDEGKIPRLPIYVDSPLATNLTEVFRDHRAIYDEESITDFRQGDAPLAFRNLKYTQSVDESKALNNSEGPYIVISASGMMTAGRVVHHLRHSIADKKNAILITGYQAAGTLGRRLLEGAKRVELYGDWFNVAADVLVFNEFSAHSDHAQMSAYLNRFKGIKQVLLVHGEPNQADDFKTELAAAHEDWIVQRPNEGDTVEIPPPASV